MEGKQLLKSLRLRNILSYGSSGEEITLEPLNVLIGPNASGKSNVIEALSLLQAAPNELAQAIRDGGGVSDWLWKGAKETPNAEIDATIHYSDADQSLRYRLYFTRINQRFEIIDEAIENAFPSLGHDDPYFYYRYQNGRPALNVRTRREDPVGTTQGRDERRLRREELSPEQSVLSQRKDPDQYPELTYVGRQFDNIRLYKEWDLGRYTAPRLPQKADLPGNFLSENANNLGLVLNNLEHNGDTYQRIETELKRFYEPVTKITTRIEGGTVQIFLRERGLREPIPATRLSDGTLRYLCLLAVLLHPSPPPLICIEEPELGLHPDIIPSIADLLIEASQRTQLIITTHSDTLVSALSSTPEAVLVCERSDEGSTLRRLDAEALTEWLNKYTLGELWRMGEIGGTRW